MFGFIRKFFGKSCPEACCAAPAVTINPTASIEAALRGKLLNPDYEFRTFETLHKAAPTLGHDELVETLERIGARQAYRNPSLYGLKSRVGSRARRNEY
jgi:hypothetical protein